MFFHQSTGLESLLDRSRPSLWQQFWSSPCEFLAVRLYALTRPTTTRAPITQPVTVVCVSDTHNAQCKLPEGDLLVHAGDLTQSGSFKELQATLDWLRLQPHRHKVVVAGNHDLLLDRSLDHRLIQANDGQGAEDLDWGDIIYLQDATAKLTCANGRLLRVYGSPRSPKHGNWAFQYPRSENIWQGVVPPETDILITHGPPRAHLDLQHLGCINLLAELWKVRPTLHVFGHVHEGYGQEWLHYDDVQRAFERVMQAHGGVLNLLLMMKDTLLSRMKPNREPATLLVNPSMVGGLRDDQRRQPIVVTI